MTISRRTALRGLASAGLLTSPLLAVSGCERSEPPETPEGIAVRLPPIARTEFAGDAQLYITSDPSAPIVAIGVAIQAGFAADPPGRAGVAALWRDCLDSRDQRGYRALGTHRWTRLSARSLGIGCTVAREHAGAALRLLLDDLRRLDCSPEQLDEQRRLALQDLLATRGDPQRVAGYGLVFASLDVDPPTAALARGSIASLQRLTVEDLWRWRDEYVRPSLLSFGFAGGLDHDRAVDAIVAATKGWAVPARRESLDLGEAPRFDDERFGTVLVEWPARTDAILSLVAPSAELGEADELVLALASGLVFANLYDELRNELRVSYSFAEQTWTTRAGPLAQRWTAIAPGSLDAALTGITRRLESLHEEPSWLRVRAERWLEHARLSYYVAMMREYATVESSLAQLLAMADIRMPVDSAYQRFEQLRMLDAERLGKAILVRFPPDRPRLSVVADRSALPRVEGWLGDMPRSRRSPEQLIA